MIRVHPKEMDLDNLIKSLMTEVPLDCFVNGKYRRQCGSMCTTPKNLSIYH